MSSNYLSADNGVISGTPGIIPQGGSDGTLQLRSSTSAGVLTTALTIDNNQNISTVNAVNLPNTFGFKNRLINGAMGIWQRGTSGFTSGYAADRWQGINTTSISQSTDTPSSAYKYSFDFLNTSATFPLAAQNIESVNCLDLVGQSITISFWAKNVSGTANLYTEIQYANSVDNFSSTTLITNGVNATSPSSSWTYYSITFNNLPSQIANGLQARIIRNNASAAETRITGVQLEKGTQATSFDYRPYGTEFQLCQRYLPCYNSQSSSSSAVANGYAYNTSTARVLYSFQVQPRVPPTGITVNNAANFQVETPGIATGQTSGIGFVSASLQCVDLVASSSAAFGVGGCVLESKTSSAQIQFTGCEL
jgi:hypothetical protein